MVSGHEDRNQPQRGHIADEIALASMVSGHEDRNQITGVAIPTVTD